MNFQLNESPTRQDERMSTNGSQRRYTRLVCAMATLLVFGACSGTEHRSKRVPLTTAAPDEDARRHHNVDGAEREGEGESEIPKEVVPPQPASDKNRTALPKVAVAGPA